MNKIDKKQSTQSTIGVKFLWFVFGVLILVSVAYAGNTLSNSGITIGTNDAIVKLFGYNSLLGSPTTPSGGIEINQTRPEAKAGIWWDAYDPASDRIRPAIWLVSHYNSSTGNGVHQHFSIESLDNSTGTPSINSKFYVTYGSNLTASDPELYAKFSTLSSVILGDAVDLILSGSSSDIRSTTALDIYPNNQVTTGLRVDGNSTNGLLLSATGTSDIKINGDNLTITALSGSGNAFACLDANGLLYRSATACA